MWKVTVYLVNGETREFTSEGCSDLGSDGKVMYWENVMLNHSTIDLYSIPIHQIVELRETEYK